MSNLPEQRREQILLWLRDEALLRIDDLAQRLNVSHMTVHRDLDALAEMSLVEKVHGGVRSPDPYRVTTDACQLCEMPVKARLHFVLMTAQGQNIRACCAHCGLLLLNSRHDVTSALIKDFIYGRIINVRQAHFVIHSRVSLCCEPGVLAFADRPDADDFQRGFGGEVMDFDTARRYLTESHHCSS